MHTIHDRRYDALIEDLRQLRESVGMSQDQLAEKLGMNQSQVSKVESKERRIDIVELFDWVVAMGANPANFLAKISWWVNANSPPPPEVRPEPAAALPIQSKVDVVLGGVDLLLRWQDQIKRVRLEGVTADQYLAAEAHITKLYQALNTGNAGMNNREAIFQAFTYATTAMPSANPSDLWHHVVYRLYLREYRASRPEQSWVRAGGEAMELFVQNHYTPIFAPMKIRIQALLSASVKRAALQQMGLVGLVGNSKLDVALYGVHGGREVIFGGVHCKASLAERVSDDVPCSAEMMKKGYASFLYTFDVKSFPPPSGDLVNYGELGSPTNPSDKRQYIEAHGSFDACYSYNTRTSPSRAKTHSGKRIFVCTYSPGGDVFPQHVLNAWNTFKQNLK